MYISAKEVDRKNTRKFFNLHGLTLRDALGQVKPCGTNLTSEVKQKAGISDDDDETKIELCQDIADLRPVNPNRTRVKIELLVRPSINLYLTVEDSWLSLYRSGLAFKCFGDIFLYTRPRPTAKRLAK